MSNQVEYALEEGKLGLRTPQPLDLVISAVMALGFPFLAGMLLQKTGALLPMAIYYGAAWGLSFWRRGRSGYRPLRETKTPIAFWVNCGVIGISLLFAYMGRITVESPVIWGVVLTALLWAPANASSEQLLWIYIFDSWDLYPQPSGSPAYRRWIFRGVGLLLFSAFVGLIHMAYWAKFLHTVDAGGLIGGLFILGTTVSGYLHIVAWRKGKNMVYTFVPHFMLNLLPLVWTGYSITHYLFIS